MRPAPAQVEPGPPGLETRLSDPRLLGRARARAAATLGLHTAGDLLGHFPRRYEDRTRFDTFPSTETGGAVCVSGRVGRVSLRRFGRNRLFEAELISADGGATLVLRWFGLRYIHKLVATNDLLIVHGRVRQRGRRLCIEHPEFEKIEPDGDDPPIQLDRLTPVHPAGGGVSTRALRTAVYRVLDALGPDAFPAVLPEAAAGLSRAEAYRAIHFPRSVSELQRARETLVLEEFFRLQLMLAARKLQREALRGTARPVTGRLAGRLHARLPFPLTAAQRRVIAEIRADYASGRPMHRLLQGDVGSGKTLVAITAMLDAVESGFQAALMAPTQVLAEQHHRTLIDLAAPLGLRIALCTGSRREMPEHPGIPHLWVGTHALLSQQTGMERLGLVVIDEQHKFGVLQQARLWERGQAPGVLVMTATPIPRTLALAWFADLDVSELDELPAGRRRVQTVVRDAAQREKVAAFLRGRLDRGRQAFIVCPLVDGSARTESKAAKAEVEAWSRRLAPHRVGLLHGRQDVGERNRVLAEFRSGRIAALVTTTVIEVGIDVPNASVLLVENAERFGLAQLHQLRGRVGRGAHPGACILLVGTDSNGAAERLRVLERTADGFEIAEEDLRQRGPGDLAGVAQSGLPPLRLGDLVRDAPLMLRARELAQAVLAADPGLDKPENQRLRSWVVEPKTPDGEPSAPTR